MPEYRRIIGRLPLGICGDLIRTSLFLVNLLLFIFGFLIFTFSALVKFGHAAKSELKDINPADNILKTGAVNQTTTVFMVLASIIMLFSLFGLYGTNQLSKIFLVIYYSIVLFLFLVHFIILIGILYGFPFFQESYLKTLNNTITGLNNEKNVQNNCDLMKGFSAVFECCGIDGPSDFNNATIAQECCSIDKETARIFQDGCKIKSVKEFRTGLNSMLIPSLLILVLEIFIISMVPFLIGRVHEYEYI